jgi:putative DNA primase/helicase
MFLTSNEIASRLGLKRTGRNEYRGQCPACAYGGSAFVLTERVGRPLFWCASCRDSRAIAQAIGLGHAQPRSRDPVADAERTADKRERAAQLWLGSKPAAGTLADTYLATRGLPGLAQSLALRFHADCPHPTRVRCPALVGLVTDVAGSSVAAHRTYLRADGRGKAAVEPAKASLGPVWGGAIRLQPHDPARPLVVGEGIETAASAGRLIDAPAWAAISAGNMATGLILPPQVRRIVIAADNDEPGREAATEAWARWRSEGREVRIAFPGVFADFNDLLRGEN